MVAFHSLGHKIESANTQIIDLQFDSNWIKIDREKRHWIKTYHIEKLAIECV